MSPNEGYSFQAFLIIPQPLPRQQPQGAGRPCGEKAVPVWNSFHHQHRTPPSPTSWFSVLCPTQMLHARACTHRLAHAELRPLHATSSLPPFVAGQIRSRCISSPLTSRDLLFPEYTQGEAKRIFQSCHCLNIYSKMTPCPLYCVSFNDSLLPITR